MNGQSDFEWRGYAIHDTDKHTDFKVIDFKPKQAGDYDVDIKIEYCGVCGSDVHTITGGWGKPMLPVIPGHEIVGTVTRVGPKVKEFKIGDRAGVGPLICSCFQCDRCKTDNEQYCTKTVSTYNDKYPNEINRASHLQGDITQGGYSTGIRAHERFVFPIPDALPLEQAAPMLCAGLTVYSPLVRNGAGPGKKVGVVGVGGLGHFAIQFAKALGAEVTVFSHSDNKQDDAVKMGASHFVKTSDGFEKDMQGKLDLIICTADVSDAIPLTELITTLKIHGRLVMVALPDDKLPALQSTDLVSNGALLGGSLAGSKKEAIEMLKLAADRGVKSWIEMMPMSKAGEAIQSVKDNNVRYRHVLKVDI